MFDQGDRVITPGGPGEVSYKRMAPPTFSEVHVYSVKLDSKKDQIGYSGTVYLAAQVQPEPK